MPVVKLSWLTNAIVYGDFSNREKNQYANVLIDYTSNSFEFNTRLIAIGKLFEIQYFNRNLLMNIINGSTSFNHHLVGPFRNILSEFVKNNSFRNELELILKEEKLSDDEHKYLRVLLGD